MRGEMGLGSTLSALPVENGGTGASDAASARANLGIGTGGAFVDAVYPVGSIYMSVNSADPRNLFGGTWQRIQDTFLLAAGSTYSAGTTGGEASHKLTVDEMPGHGHVFKYSSSTGSTHGNKYLCTDGSISTLATSNGGSWDGSDIKSATGSVSSNGGGSAHNNMPPYLAVYVWKRTK